MISINKIINKIPAPKKAAIISSSAASVTELVFRKINNINYDNFNNAASKNELTIEDFKVVKKIARRVMKDRNLTKKGVRIKNINKKPLEGVLAKDKLSIIEQCQKDTNGVFVSEAVKYKDGRIYANKNEVLINYNKPSVSLLHELGHADNHNNSKFLKHFQLLKHKVEPVISNIAQQNAIFGSNNDKAYRAFLHKNSTIISALAQIPTLVEEGVASCKAIRWIRLYCGNEKLAKQAQKEFSHAYFSYITQALSKVVPTEVSRVTKDKMLQKFQTKV